MKKSVIKFFDKIIVVLLGILGVFNSCEKPLEYGTPHANYEVKGVITNKETSKPIQNIQVIRQIHQEYGDTLYTDADGKYVFAFGDFPYKDNVYRLKIEDIDGEENGGDFVTKEIEVKITQADQIEKGDGNWYDGKFSKIVNIELEKEPVFVPLYGVKSTTFKP
ncbi:MAG: radical SAM-associated putative lipoprotein [Lentimicrobiaceae bacterium]|nr:radical SAM-associated putative lipoprotein [Lentimicrobiaceae bacterium]